MTETQNTQINLTKVRLPKWLPVVLALFGAGLYAGNVGDYFRSDDFVSVVGITSSPIDFFTGENLSGSTFYRPVNLLTFWLDRIIGGVSPIGYHITNMVLFGLILFLFYKLLTGLFKDPKIAVIATALLAVHPAHADSVAWISGRTELVFGVFALASLVSFIRSKIGTPRKWVWYGLSVVFAFTAMLGKENAIMLPLWLIAVDLLYEKEPTPVPRVSLHIPFFLLVFLYLAIRTSVLDGVGGYGETHFRVGLFVARNFIRYIQFFFIPIDFSSYADVFIRYQQILLPVAAFAIVGALVLLRKILTTRPAVFGMLLAVLAFIPIGNLFPQNRHALTIHMGLATVIGAIVAGGLVSNGLRRKLTLTVFIVWFAVLGGFAIRASSVASTASDLSESLVKQTAMLVDETTGPCRVVALTVPDTYKNAFVLRNGLHHAMILVRPDREIVSQWLTLVGIEDVTGSGLTVLSQSPVVHEIHLPDHGDGYILLPDANWSRHKGDTKIIGPVGYRITDETPRFRVNGVELSIDQEFWKAPGNLPVAFFDGKMQLLGKKD